MINSFLLKESKINNSFIEQFVDTFLNNSNVDKFVFGNNPFSRSIADNVKLTGIIDEFTNEKELFGLKVYKLDNVPKNSLVISTLLGKPFLGMKRLRQFHIKFIDYFSFYRFAKKMINLKNIIFWEHFHDDFTNNILEYEKIYNMLEDEISKKVFINIVNFKYYYDLLFMKNFSNREKEQYFENFFDLTDKEIFVDVGAFIGDTTLEFLNRVNNYKHIYMFEPDINNYNLLIKNVAKYDKITVYNMGLSNKRESLKFLSSGSSSSFNENGDLVVNVEKLDDLINTQITFIKMDIEGAELDAVYGAKDIIDKYHPKLAISVYHKSEHIWTIPKYILNIYNNYKIYLRHYTEGVSETIMYFIPR